MTELLIWTSPRDVVVWAPDATAAGTVRATLETAGLRWWPVQIYGVPRAAATSLDIGVDADNCLRALLAAGYTFAWHPSQAPENRSPMRFGFDVAPAAE
ncbi:hypothetical protein [Cellulomonas sp. ES6]|uniref:hypothetical protein n=1 Tax=Cellulomonas sp. ES6 TaxID=3039384 RepID=UPI0024B69516|nr:hypothetical protein [Cellulomonas sp. ES6]WHP16577.1 hypothetical protein P9841_13260 [Cellulomonas sp. ES6]